MNILIIDDEPLIHISIERLIHDYSKAITVYHAYDGREMQTLLQSHDFLLAYVDIRLPGIPGLEAIRLAKEIAPYTIYYIMTGFDKFEYAKEAIRLKVEDYLMKPLDYETIKNTIENAVTLQSFYKRERKTRFRSWLESVLNQRDCPLDHYKDYYRFSVLITTDHPDFSLDTLPEKLMEYDDNFVSTLAENHVLLLFFSENADFLRNIKKKLSSEMYGPGITLFISSIVKNSEELKMSIRHLIEYSCLRIILGTENCYSIKPLLNYDSELVMFCRICETWQTAYNTKKYNDCISLGDTLCDHLERNPMLKQFQNQILRFIQHVTVSQISSNISVSELRKFLQKNVSLLIQASGNDRLIDSIIQYIQEHYCDNLSTTMLAEQFGLSSNYISNLLKQELGIRYNDYITKLRMDHAKQMLLFTNSSVKNITTACGYYSQSHFTKLFVEHEGCTPLEYRKKIKNN